MSHETYRPSPEEAERAEGMMTEEQRKLSEAREEGYRIAEAKQERTTTHDPAAPTRIEIGRETHDFAAPEKPYVDAVTEGDIEMSVGWDKWNKAYVIFFSSVAAGGGSADSSMAKEMNVSRDPNKAKQVFAFGKEIIKNDPEGFFTKIEGFSNSLPENEEYQ